MLRFEKGDEQQQQRVFDLYCKRIDRVNNWDLMDGSAPHATNDAPLCDREIPGAAAPGLTEGPRGEDQTIDIEPVSVDPIPGWNPSSTAILDFGTVPQAY